GRGGVDGRPPWVGGGGRTSFPAAAFFLESPIPPGPPDVGRASGGEEARVSLPPLLRARLTGTPTAVTVRRSTRYRLMCHLENAGHATWPRPSPAGFGLVLLAASPARSHA